MVASLCIAALVELGLSIACTAMVVRMRMRQHLMIKELDALRSLSKAEKEKMELELRNLKEGATPDYEKAVQAAKAVNDFNSGIASILNFDPLEVLKAQREEHAGGEQQ